MLEDLSGYGMERFSSSRTACENSDIIVGVMSPTPTGYLRFLDWMASLSIQSFTGAISADSTIEVFEKNEKNDDVRLKYVYQMNRQANAEHKLTTGYGDLRLQDGGNVLSGFYWTNSPTEGRIVLKLVQRRCDDVNCFESAKRAFERQSRLADAIK